MADDNERKDKTIEPIDAPFDEVAEKIIQSVSGEYENEELTDKKTNLMQKKAEYAGILELGDVELSCFVTQDGERFISGRSMTGAIGMKGRGQGMARISANSTLKPFMNNALVMAIESPVEIVGKTPKPVHGYRAEILADICDAILEARKSGAISTEHEERYADFAENLVRGFARVGIAALVDEATGYQEVREKHALQKILDKFLNEEARVWSKTFPDEFWEKLVKIKGYDSYYAIKRPAFVGHWVNDIVYSRLAPGIKDKLRELNPRQSSGERKRRHHQHLTDDHGLPELKDHLKKVMVLMDAASSKKEFDRLLDKSLPKYGSTLDLPLGEG